MYSILLRLYTASITFTFSFNTRKEISYQKDQEFQKICYLELSVWTLNRLLLLIVLLSDIRQHTDNNIFQMYIQPARSPSGCEHVSMSKFLFQ